MYKIGNDKKDEKEEIKRSTNQNIQLLSFFLLSLLFLALPKNISVKRSNELVETILQIDGSDCPRIGKNELQKKWLNKSCCDVMLDVQRVRGVVGE